jgi:hypothetical protein
MMPGPVLKLRDTAHRLAALSGPDGCHQLLQCLPVHLPVIFVPHRECGEMAV